MTKTHLVKHTDGTGTVTFPSGLVQHVADTQVWIVRVNEAREFPYRSTAFTVSED